LIQPLGSALGKIRLDLLNGESKTGVDFGGGTIDLRQSFRRKQMVEIIGPAAKALQNFGYIFIDALETGLRGAALCDFEELVV
jgi:hypothetical protein